jgi:hypothetical protein
MVWPQDRLIAFAGQALAANAAKEAFQNLVMDVPR